MSLILDALKRAERERNAERSAALSDVPGAARSIAPRRRARVIAIAVIALAVGAAAWIMRDRPGRADPAATPAPQAQVTAQAPAAVPAPTPSPEQSQPGAPATIQARPAPQPIPGTEGVSSLDDLTTETDIALEPAAEPEPAPPPARVAPPASVTLKPQAPAAAPKTEPTLSEADIDEVAPEAEAQPEPPKQQAPQPAAVEPAPTPAVPPALTQPAPLRRFREMPPDYRADFPALTVEVHVFERIPSQRFVLVNGRRYRQGERMVEGPQVLEIVQEGIVLEYRGEKLLYTLGR